MDGNTLVFILRPDSTGRFDFRRKADARWGQLGSGPRFSEFPIPNLYAQVSKLWQEREWLLRA